MNATDSALAWLENARRISPSDPWIYIDFGIIYGRLNDPVRAEVYFKKAMEIDPRGPARQFLEDIKKQTR
jgi:Flp pilus assembly protein TadD